MNVRKFLPQEELGIIFNNAGLEILVKSLCDLVRIIKDSNSPFTISISKEHCYLDMDSFIFCERVIISKHEAETLVGINAGQLEFRGFSQTKPTEVLGD